MGFLSSSKLNEYTTKLMTKLRTIFATQSMVGAPKKAATVADMADSDAIYVYTGSESGYVNGNWYYYDGSGWQSGGVYNAVAISTDPTLTQVGEAADAAAVGVFKGRFEAFGMGVIDALKKIVWNENDGEDVLTELEDILFTAREMVSISASFNQGQSVVYDSDSIDSLRSMLTVIASYSDSTTEAVTTYTLSGALTAGTSTITVTYREKTASFTVVVTAEGRIPHEYQEVEYIQSSGTQIIITDYQPTYAKLFDLTAIADVMLPSTTPLDGKTNMFMGYSGWGGQWIGLMDNGVIGLGKPTGYSHIGFSNVTATNKNRFTLTASVSGSSAVGCANCGSETIQRSTSDGSPTMQFALFGKHTKEFMSAARIYYAKVSDSLTTFLELIPCYRIYDGEIGMYDTVAGKFYANEGTGTFTKGSDVSAV